MTPDNALLLAITIQRDVLKELEVKLEKSAAYMRVEGARETLRGLRSQCNHPAQFCTVKHGGSTGNYDPSCDYYDKTVVCSICGDRSCYDDDSPLYNKY